MKRKSKESPSLPVLAEASERGIRKVRFQKRTGAGTGIVAQFYREFEEYVSGERRAFSCAWDLDGVSAYTRKVLEAAAGIPYGEVLTYGELARRIGSAPRAVGQALGRNPIPVIVPCHRVVGGTGIGGFTGGSGVKRRLLAIERQRR